MQELRQICKLVERLKNQVTKINAKIQESGNLVIQGMWGSWLFSRNYSNGLKTFRNKILFNSSPYAPFEFVPELVNLVF